MAINPFFNAEYYLATNLDLQRAGLHTDEQLWEHYITFGAYEAIAAGVTNALRAPNPWFNVDYYLQANPDLGQNGVTAAAALDHYLQFGLSEGREFNPVITASMFDAVTYADDNEDLIDAFGIENVNDLTDAQKDALLQHYLMFGYKEGREGAGQIANFVQADNLIYVTDGSFSDDVTSVIGTVMDDKFIANGVDLKGKTLDGLGGNDTIEIGGDVDTDEDTVFKNIENVVVTKAKAANKDLIFSSKQTIDTLTINADVKVTADAVVTNVVNNAAEEDDAIDLNAGQAAVNLTADVDTALNLNNVKGSSITVNVVDASKDVEITVGSENSPTVGTVTIDASLTTAGVELSADDSIKAVKNVVMIGGRGDDTLNATASIDTLTGGRGDDNFKFANGTAFVHTKGEGESLEIVGIDTITDFRKGDSINGTKSFEVAGFASGDFSNKELHEILVNDKDEAGNDKDEAGNDKDEAGKLFQWTDGNTYLVLTADNDIEKVEVVKLAGVTIDMLDDWGYIIA